MAKQLTDDERQRIVDLLHDGHSARTIAAMVERSVDTVSRIARSIGWDFGRPNLARAREAKSAYSAERRAAIAARLTVEAEKLLDQLEGPYLVWNFGGKDNTYAEHELDQPPVEAKRALVMTVREAVRTVLDIDRHDNRGNESTDDVTAWLRAMTGG